MAFCMVLAFFYISRSNPVYIVESNILLNKDQSSALQINNIQGGDQTSFSGIDIQDEMELFRSISLIKDVVSELGVNIHYYGGSDVSFSRPIPLNKFPVLFRYYEKRPLRENGCSFFIHLSDDSLITIRDNDRGKILTRFLLRRDTLVSTPIGLLSLTINRLAFDTMGSKSLEYFVVVDPPIKMAQSIRNGLALRQSDKSSSLINFSLKTQNIRLGQSILEKIVEHYNQDQLSDRHQAARNKEQFMDERLKTLTADLSEIEGQLEAYRRSEQAVDLSSETQLFLNQVSTSDSKKLEIETKLLILDDLDRSISQKEHDSRLMPGGTELLSQNMNSLINKYNDLLLQRARLSRSATSSNRAMVDLDNNLNALAENIKFSISKEKQGLVYSKEDVSNQYNSLLSKIDAIPVKERGYFEIKRQQSVKEQLYLYLLQKKEENMLNMNGDVQQTTVVDAPMSSGKPVSPKKSMIFYLAFFWGLGLPILLIFVRMIFREKVESKYELEQISKVPVLGEIPRMELGTKENLLIKEQSSDIFSEMFRLTRTNLLFTGSRKRNQVIIVTSSIGSEGKTVFSINIALSLAFLNKKVLLMGLDLRRPKIHQYLDLENQIGMTSFIKGEAEKKDIILASDLSPYLSIIPSGPSIYNPNELLSSEKLDLLIGELKKEYDYIIIDSSPIGIVSDTLLLNRFADMNLYIIRADYTNIRNIEDANELYEKHKLHNMHLILNASDIEKNRKRYSYYHYYGKKHGYAYYRDEKTSGMA